MLLGDSAPRARGSHRFAGGPSARAPRPGCADLPSLALGLLETPPPPGRAASPRSVDRGHKSLGSGQGARPKEHERRAGRQRVRSVRDPRARDLLRLLRPRICGPRTWKLHPAPGLGPAWPSRARPGGSEWWAAGKRGRRLGREQPWSPEGAQAG